MTTSWMEFPGLIVFPMLVISLLSFAMFLISKIIADNLNPKSHT
jgi:ABC-type dipeptide/oligopeptide/nickel transport system permease subunit